MLKYSLFGGWVPLPCFRTKGWKMKMVEFLSRPGVCRLNSNGHSDN